MRITSKGAVAAANDGDGGGKVYDAVAIGVRAVAVLALAGAGGVPWTRRRLLPPYDELGLEVEAHGHDEFGRVSPMASSPTRFWSVSIFGWVPRIEYALYLVGGVNCCPAGLLSRRATTAASVRRRSTNYE